jgi:broad specificity phosphatase PhoE
MEVNNMERKIKSSAEKEKQPFEVLGKVSIMRHGQTEYTEQYPDITEFGIQQIEESGVKLKEKIDIDKEDVMVTTSPSVRARGSGDVLKGKLGIEEARVMKALRGVQIRDHAEALKMVNDIIGPERDISKMDQAYAHDDAFEQRVEVWEPRSEVEKRFFRGMEYITRAFLRYKAGERNKIPHLVGVSHFEFLNHIVAKVFNLDEKQQDQLKFGEMIEMTFLKKGNEEDKKRVPILITFRGETKEIVFNRETRTIESIRESQ